MRCGYCGSHVKILRNPISKDEIVTRKVSVPFGNEDGNVTRTYKRLVIEPGQAECKKCHLKYYSCTKDDLKHWIWSLGERTQPNVGDLIEVTDRPVSGIRVVLAVLIGSVGIFVLCFIIIPLLTQLLREVS